jgi:hypothetical protein
VRTLHWGFKKQAQNSDLRTREAQENNIKINVREIDYKDMNQTELA